MLRAGPGLGSVDECNKGLPENPDDADDDDDDADAGCVVGGVVLDIDERKAVTLALSVTGSMINGLKDCDRSLRKTLQEPADDRDRPPSPVFDLG